MPELLELTCVVINPDYDKGCHQGHHGADSIRCLHTGTRFFVEFVDIRFSAPDLTEEQAKKVKIASSLTLPKGNTTIRSGPFLLLLCKNSKEVQSDCWRDLLAINGLP